MSRVLLLFDQLHREIFGIFLKKTKIQDISFTGSSVLGRMRLRNKTVRRESTIWVTFLAIATMAIEWILLVAGTKPHEMIVGGFSVLASGAFLLVVQRSNTLNVKFQLADLVTCWRIPWYVISGIYEITLIFFKDLFGIEKAKSLYRVSGFKTSKTDPVLVAHRVLATAYTTAAPNFIIIGIDYKQSRMLFHQLERSSVPQMTKKLGAQ